MLPYFSILLQNKIKHFQVKGFFVMFFLQYFAGGKEGCLQNPKVDRGFPLGPAQFPSTIMVAVVM